ncbi:hypothetical protein BXZ70DRAFT_1072347 [Cristinia sonorae]|uniref:LysM domain-containing protein n=1 Tax=Cristinia sonorae TaxID=1940300 RepID=A0A8K0ULK7_9AGAR|nr:hypothetical protein BXZ70DRAFT_1072347 [Cristinia sonorae]
MFAATALVAFLALPFTCQFAFSVAAADCARKYTVKAGDYCDQISAANNASTYQLAVTNIGKINEDCKNLQPGQDICLGFVGQDCTNTYVVKAGDTCTGVAAKHGLNTTLFNHNNPQLHAECDNLYIGEVVCVGGGPAVPPLPAGAPMPAATIPPGAQPATPPKAEPVEDDEDCDDEEDNEDEDDENLPWCDEL